MALQGFVVALLLVASWGTAAPAHAQSCFVDYLVSDCNTESSTFLGAGDFPACFDDQSSYNSCSGPLTPGGDDTYQFTAPAGTEVYVALTQSLEVIDTLDLFVQEDDCGDSAGTCVGTASQLGAVNFVADGSSYYFTVDNETASCGQDYRLTFACPVPCDPGADVARSLTCSSDHVGETTASGSDVLDYYGCGETWNTVHLLQLQNELIYRFEPQASGLVTFRVDNLTSDHDIYVLAGTCDQAACVSSTTDVSLVSESVTFMAQLGVTYYIAVEAFGGPGTFDVSFADNTGGCLEDCDDGIDNDLDGDIDCDDSSCAGDPACPSLIFADGFESGDTGAWSSTVPLLRGRMRQVPWQPVDEAYVTPLGRVDRAPFAAASLARRDVATAASGGALDMLLVLDRSGSMFGANWNGAVSGLNQFFATPTATGDSAGLSFFPVEGAADQCVAGLYDPPQVALGGLPGHATTLANALSAEQPLGTSTTTYPALLGSLQFATAHQSSNPGHAVVVVLVTDGSPSECETNIAAIASLAQSAFNFNGVRTHVVGLPGSSSSELDQIAIAGGTVAARMLGDPSTLGDALSEIRVEALRLVFSDGFESGTTSAWSSAVP